MKRCSKCKSAMKEKAGKTPEGVAYQYFACPRCGEEILDMAQLHAVATKYRTLKRYHVKLSQWGLSLGVRIPKEVVERYKLKDDEEIILIPEEQGIKLIPA